MKMKNKLRLVTSSLLVILPILVGVIFWESLPDQIATHWGPDGNPDVWSSKAFAVFALPAFLLAIHWLCIIANTLDKKNRNQNPKLLGLIHWLVPVISLAANSMVYTTALGKEIDVMLFLPIIMGVLFLIIGNYLPKCTQSRTVGIKIKWTLDDEENWNATHRLGGKVWVIGAVVILLCVFLPAEIAVWVMIAVTLAMALIPIIYSYCLYRKKNGK